MRKINQKIITIILIVVLIIIGVNVRPVYGKTESDELKELLDEYEEDLGDLSQFKTIVDETYNDLYNATKVDDTLKEKLRKDVEKFEKIDGINPLIVSVLDIELNSQINNLSDDNIDDMREEITAIKEWVDENVSDNSDDDNSGSLDDGDDDITNGDDTSDDFDDDSEDIGGSSNISSGDTTIAGTKLPRAGVRGFLGIIFVATIVLAIICITKYRKLREIK